ncbi:trans,polycis-polyprenyl diphosphate synthase ((2Z,6E)-farnesyl diphosphate specific) [Arthrobacter sp. Hiyo8]|nr:trans,polycis-polyprenyl diphosphate synthase ((2Z,6E)-farnesyl diphosphate specific) [Arthrobacter sp. Hiyo8]
MWSEAESGTGKKEDGNGADHPGEGPYHHPSGARPPAIPAELIPRHVAIVMDGNGRWANQRGLRALRVTKPGSRPCWM